MKYIDYEYYGWLGFRLTLTWDVLKLVEEILSITENIGLTLTWDVLK